MRDTIVCLLLVAAQAGACHGGARGSDPPQRGPDQPQRGPDPPQRGSEPPQRGGLAYGESQDVADVLASGGVKVPVGSLACVNPTSGGGVTRAIACTTTLTAAQVAALRAGLPLAPHAPWLKRSDGSCEDRAEFRSTNPAVRVLVGKNTRVTNGVGRVEVHVIEGSPAACIEVEYPWSE